MIATTQKNLKVSILGKSYSLATDEESDVVYRAAAMLDQILQNKSAMIQAGAVEKVFVVTALQLAAELVKAQASIGEYENFCKNLLNLTGE